MGEMPARSLVQSARARVRYINGPELQPIERVDGRAGRPVVREVLRRNRPVVFEHLIDHWPATSRWTHRWFGDTLGDIDVKLFDFTQAYAIPSTLAAFVDWLDGAREGALAGYEDLYLSWDFSVLRGKPALRDDFDFHSLFPPGIGKIHCAFWMGGTGSHTPLHYDLDYPNLHACLSGRKRFVLFGPDQTEHLYPSDIYEWTTEFSAVDLRLRDLSHYPNAARARGVVTVLEPGDVLFLPGLWWHAAWCLEPCVSLNGWFYTPRVLIQRRVLREVARAALHKLGLYAKDRCTCCGHGDLRQHLGWPTRVPAHELVS